MIPRLKILKGGKISIPFLYGKSLNFQEGGEILFNFKNGKPILSPLKLALQNARKTISNHYSEKESLVDRLISVRREEALHE